MKASLTTALQGFLARYLVWPSRRFCIGYFSLVGLLSLYSAVSVALSPPPQLTTAGQLGAACLIAVTAILAFGVLYLELAVCYKLLLDAVAGYKKFRAWLPGALSSTGAAIAATFKALGRALRFLLALPGATVRLLSRLRLPTVEEVALTCFMISGFAIAGTIGYLFWPLATRLALSMPAWLPGAAQHSSDYFEILLLDALISCIPYSIALSIWSALVRMVVQRFKSKKP